MNLMLTLLKWIWGSRIRSRPGPMDFFQTSKIMSMTSFGREVKPWVPCRRFTHVKEPQAEIRASEQNLSAFSRFTVCRKRRWWPKMFKSVVKPNNKNNFTKIKLIRKYLIPILIRIILIKWMCNFDVYHHHHQSILPKGRSFTSNSGTKAAVLFKGRSSTANWGTQAAVLLEMDRCGSFPLLSAPQSLFSIWTDLKRSEKFPETPAWRWGEWIWLTGPSGLHRNSPQGLNITCNRVFDQIRDP